MDYNLKESLRKLLNAYNTAHISSNSHDSRYLKISNIINNNAVNQEGYALDARQANPTIQGSMAEKITSLETTCTEVASKVEDLENRIAFLETYEQWGTF